MLEIYNTIAVTKIAFSELSIMNIYGEVYLPYVWGLLRAHCESMPQLRERFEWQEPIYKLDFPEELLKSIDAPDIMGFSCYVWNWQKHLELSRLVKQAFPNCLIVFGGPHVSHTDVDFFDKYPWIDLAVHGEGEIAFQKILEEHLKPTPDFTQIKGVYSKNKSAGTAPSLAERLPPSTLTDSPYTLGYFDKIISDVKSSGQRTMARFESTRGCPYRCAYCDWGTSGINTSVHKLQHDRTLREIEYFGAKQIDYIYLTDANTGMLERDLEMAKKVVAVREQHSYPKAFYMSMAKNSNERVFEMSRLLYNADLLPRGANISVQTMNPEALTAIDRQMIGIEKFIALKALYKQHNIPTNTEFILGLPNETLSSFKNGFYQIFEYGFDDGLEVFSLTALPNAPMTRPEYIKKNGLSMLKRKLFFKHPVEQGVLAEKIDVVIETNSMTKKDWVEMNVFAAFILVLHTGGALRNIAHYFKRRHNISYGTFYENLLTWANTKQHTVLSKAVNKVRQSVERVLEDETANFVGYETFEFDFNGQTHTINGHPRNQIWAILAFNRNLFFTELLGYFFEEYPHCPHREIEDLLSFQNTLWFSIDYDPVLGKVFSTEWDWNDFFSSIQTQVKKNHTYYQIDDQIMGLNSPDKIVPGDIKQFFKASQSLDSADRKRYILTAKPFAEIQSSPHLSPSMDAY